MTLYIPPLFRVEDRGRLIDFIEANAFGTLVCSGPGGLHVSHVPFLVDRGPGDRLSLQGHEARANGQLAALAQAEHVLAIFEGPHGYISPTWYEHHPSVPTWNYAVVHAQGKVRMLDDAAVLAQVTRLSRKYEAGNAKPWRIEDLTDDFRAAMLRSIGGFAIDVETLEGKFKLSQNRPGKDAWRVMDALEGRGDAALAAFMREHYAGTGR